MSNRALEVVEFLLTAHLYTENRDLDENDLPPRYRRVFWTEPDEDDGTGGGTDGNGGTDGDESNVVGIALLIGVTAVSLGLVAASAGTMLDAQTERADTARVATGIDDAVRPAETTGVRERRVAILGGSFETVPRDLRVLDDGAVVAERSVSGLRFENDGGGATFVAGAVLRYSGGTAVLSPPGIRLTDDRLVVNAPVLHGDVSYAASGRNTVMIRTAVTHSRTDLGPGPFSVAIETSAPETLARVFRERGRSVEHRDLDGDGVESVIVAYPDATRGLLFTHDAEVSVSG